MPLSNVSFNRNASGLGRPPEGTEHVSGLIVWRDIANNNNQSFPSGFSSSDNKKLYRSITDAEDDGITSDPTDVFRDFHYHIDQFFRLNPNGELYVAIYDKTAPDYTDLGDLQTFANGEIYQFGAYGHLKAFDTNEVDKLQSALDTLESDHQPAVAILANDHSGTASGDMDTLTDLTTLSDQRVAVTIGQDGGNTGANLFSNLGYSITDLGAKLGALATARVHENIGWVGEFPMSESTAEFDEPAFANGDLNKIYSSGELDTIDSNHYIFLRKFVGNSGTYNSYSFTAVPKTNDFSELEANRTMDKAVRQVRTVLLPLVNSPLYVNTDGTLDELTIEQFRSTAEGPLEVMVAEGNLSFQQVTIDPNQDVLTTDEIKVNIELGKVGVARTISVPIKYVTQTS